MMELKNYNSKSGKEEFHKALILQFYELERF